MSKTASYRLWRNRGICRSSQGSLARLLLDAHEDFDAIAWCWMILLGLVRPGVLLIVGWWL